MAIYSYDDLLEIYAYHQNHLRIVATQGEGTDKLTSQLTDNDLLKAPRFQLCDERGVLSIPTSGNPRVQLAVKKQNGAEDLLDCIISDASNGIVTCPIRKSLTDVPGEVEGEIRLITANAVIKFTGIDFFIYEGVSDNAAMQSSQFSDLVLALQQVSAIITGGSSGTVALDTVIQHGGTKPVASGVIYDFVDGNYMRYKSISGAEADTANDSRAIYRHHTSGFRGLIFFAGYNNYTGSTTVKQFRLCKNGRFEYRTGTVNTPADTPNTYTWDKTYDEDWNPIGSTQNIQDLAIIAGKIADEAIITQKIKDLAVTTAKIATGAVVESKIANGSVTHDKIGNFAVSDNNIDTGAVTTAKIATKAVTSDKIDDGAITTDKIEDSAVATDKIRDLSVTTAKLADGSVETNKIADSAVTTNKINDLAVTKAKIADSAVTSGKIADSAVITDKIATRAVTPNKLDRTYKESLSISATEIDDAVQENVIYHTIVGGEVASVRCVYNGSALRAQYAETVSGKMKYRTQAKAAGEWQAWSDWHPIGTTQNIDDSAVTTAKINDLAVTTDKLKDNAVKTGKINDGAVTQSKLAGDSVGTNELINGSVTTAKINSGAITTGKLDDKAVTTAKLDDDAVTNDKLADDAVDTSNIIDGAVTSDKIADGAVDTAQLAYAAVTQDNIDSGAVGTDELENASVTAIKLANNSVISAKIVNGAVTADKLVETYVKVEQTIAGIDLGDNITASELAHALAYALVNNEGLLNRTPDIYIGKRSAPISGGSTQEYYVNDIYINVLTGELWVCTSATIASVWSYTWDYRGAIYNYPLIITCEIDSENWDNTDYDLTSELRDIADGRNMVDVDFDNTVYNQLVVDGCYGLYVTTNTSTARPTFTLHAMNNAPTNNITIQLTLSQVVMSQ